MATRSKYGNKKHEVDGITFDSKAEARYYMKLKRNGMSFMPLSETYCAMQEKWTLSAMRSVHLRQEGTRPSHCTHQRQ